MRWGHRPLKVSRAHESVFLGTKTNYKLFRKKLSSNMCLSRTPHICKSCWVLGSTRGVGMDRVFGTNNLKKKKVLQREDNVLHILLLDDGKYFTGWGSNQCLYSCIAMTVLILSVCLRETARSKKRYQRRETSQKMRKGFIVNQGKKMSLWKIF